MAHYQRYSTLHEEVDLDGEEENRENQQHRDSLDGDLCTDLRKAFSNSCVRVYRRCCCNIIIEMGQNAQTPDQDQVQGEDEDNLDGSLCTDISKAFNNCCMRATQRCVTAILYPFTLCYNCCVSSCRSVSESIQKCVTTVMQCPARSLTSCYNSCRSMSVNQEYIRECAIYIVLVQTTTFFVRQIQKQMFLLLLCTLHSLPNTLLMSTQ